MAGKPGSPIATEKQRRLATLLIAGEKPLIECYAEAYEQTPEQMLDRGKLAQRAYAASKSKNVLRYIEKLQQAQAVEEARLLVWDKRRAAKWLLQMCKEIETNVEITRKLRDDMLSRPDLQSPQKLTQMLKVSEICNDTTRAIKEILQEMNKMYGLTTPEVSMVNAVQVIIGSAEQLPEDTVDEE